MHRGAGERRAQPRNPCRGTIGKSAAGQEQRDQHARGCGDRDRLPGFVAHVALDQRVPPLRDVERVFADPEVIEAVAASYVEAGSQVILTNTFTGDRFTLEGHGLADRAAELSRAGAALSRRAAGTKAHVFASMGPSGKMLLTEEVIYSADQTPMEFSYNYWLSELFRFCIINSAVFHAGFLTGGSYFDYRLLNEQAEEDRPYFEWRNRFFKVCAQFQVSPAAACIQFGLSHPCVLSIALNTSKPGRIRGNIESFTTAIDASFWRACKEEGLIQQHYPYLG